MTIRRATPEETEAFYGQGLIIFNQRSTQAFRRQRDEQRKREAERPQNEQEEGDDESNS